MKTILRSLAFLFVCAIGISCESDDGPSYKFLDRDLSGEIDNEAWAYEDGYAEIDDFGGEEMLDINLTLVQAQSGCDIFIPEGNQVFFSVPNAVGLYKLSFDFNGGESQTVTLWDDSKSLNIICGDGAVQILSITANEVSGRIDARSDKDSHVNGNFTLNICP